MPDRPDRRAEILAEAASRLTTKVSELTDTVGTFSRRLGENERRVKTNERRAHTLRILVIVDIVMTIAIALLTYFIFSTNNRVTTMCPAYAFIVGSYAPQSRTAGADRDAYTQAFIDMRAQFADLGCGPKYPLVPGAAHPPAAAGN